MSHHPIHIREYHPKDQQTVITLNRYGLAAAGVPVDADVYAGDLDDDASTYRTDRAILLVGEINDTVIAMGALRPVDGETCEIVRMRVNPDWQGRGYGRAILNALERRAIDLGYRRAVLLTGPEQHPAIDLYTKFGYQLVAVENHGKLSGIRLSKDLRSPLANNPS